MTHDTDLISDNDRDRIREALNHQADQAVDSRRVMAALQQGKRRYRGMAMIAATAVAVAAAVTAVVVPLNASRDSATNPADQPPPAAAAQTVLLLGLDSVGHTDTIVLAHLSATGAATAVSLPRDIVVDLPGQSPTKLNQVYRLGREAAGSSGPEADRAGAKRLAEVVGTLTGTKVDHYVALDMAKFGDVSSAVGGVEVCLVAASKDVRSGASFPAGKQKISGDHALDFLRQRSGLPNGDLDRVRRQQHFLQSLVAGVTSERVLADRSAVTAIVGAVRTDPDWDVLAFAKRVSTVTDLRVATIPVTDKDDNVGSFTVDPTAVTAFVARFWAGEPTTAVPGQPSTPGAEPFCVN